MNSSLNVNPTLPYALVTGGSKGIGYAIAKALARRRYNLILVARDYSSLSAAKENLETIYSVRVEILSHDLSREESADKIAKWCIDRDVKIKILCNAAGLGGEKDYLSLPLSTLRHMVKLNLESCMAMSLVLLPLLEKNAPSYILNVSSLAGFSPMPSKNIYSATKAAVIYFSYALRFQLEKKNISVSCLAPGPVFTKTSIESVTRKKMGWFGVQMAVPPEEVGEIAVRRTLEKKLIIVPGRLAKISAAIIRTLPKRWITNIYGGLDRSDQGTS
ncbi:MAG TPA: SDR family NAD(P)-dependent oxidoreductase [Chryseolinea sp.]|nr:SDR family NAD(P)-dependent oxidoreductase [Chryseolinea sp.]